MLKVGPPLEWFGSAIGSKFYDPNSLTSKSSSMCKTSRLSLVYNGYLNAFHLQFLGPDVIKRLLETLNDLDKGNLVVPYNRDGQQSNPNNNIL